MQPQWDSFGEDRGDDDDDDDAVRTAAEASLR